MKELSRTLWIRFTITSMPFGLLVLVASLVHLDNPSTYLPLQFIRPVGISLFVISIVMNVGFPIIMRTRFHDRAIAADNQIGVEKYLVYQTRLFVSVGVGAAFAGLAYLLVVSNFHLYGSILSALYGIYSILPFPEKTSGELKAYGCKPESTE